MLKYKNEMYDNDIGDRDDKLWRYYEEAMHGVGGLALCKMERSQSHHCLISNCALESFLVRIRKELDKV